MAHLLQSLSLELAAAVDTAAASVVQVQSRRRPLAGVVFDTDTGFELDARLYFGSFLGRDTLF